MDPARLQEMMACVDAHDIEIDSIIVVRHGAIVFEEYGPDYGPYVPHHLQSATKSFSSMLIGIAIHQGLLDGVDEKVVDLFQRYTIDNLDPRKERMTLEHLLTMSDGFDWHELDYPYDDPRNTLGQMWRSQDAVQHVLDRPMAREPGASWAYDSGTSILLGGVIEEVSGQSPPDFAQAYLFDPLGIRVPYWQRTTGGHYHTDGGLYLTPRDMARFGYLMLHGGTWDGQEIVPAEWVARSTAAHYPAAGGYGYGYQWWTLPGEIGYAARGHYEQIIYVLPEADMVVVITAGIPDDSPYRADGLLYRFILPACTDLPDEERTETFASYGLSFDYPRGFARQEAPLPGREAVSAEAGIVQVQSTWFPLELMSVVWGPTEAGVDAGVFLDQVLDAMFQTSGIDLVLGDALDSHKDGQPLAVRFFEAEVEDWQLSGVSGAWHCTASGRSFVFTYVTMDETTPQALQAAFEASLAGLACHGPSE
jgi:CubicO group peptidase (beta-lactamase class C family)